MKYSIFFILIFIIGCSSWSNETRLTYGAMMVTQGIDYAQTYKILNDDRYYEENPIVKSDTELIQYIVVTNVAILAIAHILNDDHRKLLFFGKACFNASNAWHNFEVGVRF